MSLRGPPYAKEVAEIINMIRNRDYAGALNKALALINSGNQLIKRCIQYIVGASVNLTMDWLGAAKCLLVFAEAAGLGGALGFAVATVNIPLIIGSIKGIIEQFHGRIPDMCKRFWQKSIN